MRYQEGDPRWNEGAAATAATTARAAISSVAQRRRGPTAIRKAYDSESFPLSARLCRRKSERSPVVGSTANGDMPTDDVKRTRNRWRCAQPGPGLVGDRGRPSQRWWSPSHSLSSKPTALPRAGGARTEENSPHQPERALLCRRFLGTRGNGGEEDPQSRRVCPKIRSSHAGTSSWGVPHFVHQRWSPTGIPQLWRQRPRALAALAAVDLGRSPRASARSCSRRRFHASMNAAP
jgi:hypothetical protein